MRLPLPSDRCLVHSKQAPTSPSPGSAATGSPAVRRCAGPHLRQHRLCVPVRQRRHVSPRMAFDDARGRFCRLHMNVETSTPGCYARSLVPPCRPRSTLAGRSEVTTAAQMSFEIGLRSARLAGGPSAERTRQRMCKLCIPLVFSPSTDLRNRDTVTSGRGGSPSTVPDSPRVYSAVNH